MPSPPLTVAPLVPRANTKTKKKKPGFRPVSKSNSKATSKSKPSDSQTKVAPSLGGKSRNERDGEDPERLHSQDAAAGESTQAQASHRPTTEPLASAASPRSTTTAKPSATRKRKQSTTISVGLRKESNGIGNHGEASPASKRKSTQESSIVPVATTKDVVHDDKEATRIITSPSSTRTTTESTIVDVANSRSALAALPALSAYDREILDRLAAEDTGAARLSSFCSSFQRETTKPRRRKGKAANATETGKSGNSSHRGNTQNQNPNTPSNSNNNNNTPANHANARNAADASGTPAVQIVDGEIVLQESSLVVPGQRRTVQEVEEEFQDVVEEDAQLAIVGASYNSFVNRKGPQHWNAEDTKRFFEALRQLGTDFCSMEAFFENRNRKQLKNKYRAELIRNPALVELALHPKNKNKVDISIFNVEVDPKAIEAAANEEPPPYIPTDVDDDKDKAAPPATGTTTLVAASPDENGDPLNKDNVAVEEDAEEEEEEEREKGARAVQTNSLSAKESSSTIWPISQDEDIQEPMEDEIDFPEPSMEDFFQEQEEILDPGMIKETDAPWEVPADTVALGPLPSKSAPSHAPPKGTSSTTTTTTTTTTKPAIALVPNKTGKSKKPKFRSLSRKKK